MSRRQHRGRRSASTIRQLPWRTVENPFAPVDVLNEEQVSRIIDAALTILETTGFRFLDQEGRALLERSGAVAAGKNDMLRLDRQLVIEKIALAPDTFRLRARNPARDLEIGGRRIVFSAVGGPAFVSDLDKGRRPGTYAELCDYFKVIQGLNIVHQEGGGCFEAMDLPAESRHLRP